MFYNRSCNSIRLFNVNGVISFKKRNSLQMKYNITQHLNIFILIFTIFLLFSFQCTAQNLPISKYGVHFVNRIALYNNTTKDSLKKMTDLQSFMPDIVIDLRYATT